MSFKHNFNSGPAAIFPEVRSQAIAAIENFHQTGLSILEYGHRTPLMYGIIEEAGKLVKKLLDLDDDFEVVFQAGGATVQNYQIPMNFVAAQQRAAYIDTGWWSKLAIQCAQEVSEVVVVASSEKDNYTHIPKQFDIPADAQYLHIVTNNTAFGTQWQEIPDYGLPLVADMTSDIFSAVRDNKKCSVIYAGAQKTAGIAGCSIIVIRKDFLARQVRTGLPYLYDYQAAIREKSMINTPPVFAIYTMLLTLRHLDKNGGVAWIDKINRQKADLLYKTLEKYPLYRLPVQKQDRSTMNVCFSIDNQTLQDELLAFLENNGCFGTKGHAKVGGFRIALYNAVPLASVQFLCSLIEEFAQKHRS